jgi:hypothetical protein
MPKQQFHGERISVIPVSGSEDSTWPFGPAIQARE